MMQSADNRFGADRVGFAAAMTRTGLFVVVLGERRIRNVRAQRHVRPSCVVMRHPRLKNQLELRFGQWYEPIETLAPNGADDSLADRIGFRAARWRLQPLDAKSAHGFVEMRGKDAVAIMQ